MPCSDQHATCPEPVEWIPILDEIRARPDPDDPETARKLKHPGWGGRRPGAGARKGNLNALKHGRTSRRQARLLEGALDIPEVRQTLIDLANRERRRRKKAEEGYGVMMTRLLEKVAAVVIENDQGQNNQEFLDFLNTVTAEIRKILQTPSRRRRITVKRPPQPDA
jgi:hypothetical protein